MINEWVELRPNIIREGCTFLNQTSKLLSKIGMDGAGFWPERCAMLRKYDLSSCAKSCSVAKLHSRTSSHVGLLTGRPRTHLRYTPRQIQAIIVRARTRCTRRSCYHIALVPARWQWRRRREWYRN
jgi:hypothetical protein